MTKKRNSYRSPESKESLVYVLGFLTGIVLSVPLTLIVWALLGGK